MSVCLKSNKAMSTGQSFIRVYVKFLLAAGFLLLGIYIYRKYPATPLKAYLLMAVGVGYLIYGIYMYQKEKPKAGSQ